jgi:ParB-like chromosome segregation protein Spo0J|tara:strand:- start:855 stop:1403 length:549 start_codon:yes stop_codon:yes gene_type:complete
MKIELVKPDSIIPYEKNPRKNIHAIDLIKQSIKEFGFRQPIVVDENNIILVGHTRLLASKALGLKEVPIHRAMDLTDIQKNSYRIMDNKSAESAEWDYDLLKLEIMDIPDEFKILTGFKEDEIENLLTGWQSDIEDLKEIDGVHLDPLKSIIKIELDENYKDKVEEVIKKYCDTHNISIEIK